MEFFMWMEVARAITQAVLISLNDPALPSDISSYIGIMRNIYFIILGCTALLYLTGHIFGGIGLYKIAKQAGNRHAWMAFVPLLNTYLVGEIAGEFTVFGQKMKRGGLYAMLLEALVLAVQIFIFTVDFLTLDPAFFVLKEGQGPVIDPTLMSAGAQKIYLAASILSYIDYAVQLVMLFFMCVVFNAFFKKYYARGPFLMTFLCVILPARGYVLFAVRNNAPVDYNAYLRRRMEQYARTQSPYGGYNGGNGGGYNGSGGYGGGYNGGSYNGGSGGYGGDAPFSDFGGPNNSNGSNGSGDSDGSNGSNGSGDAPFSDF